MQIDSSFAVVAPIEKVWETLMDFERVAGCLPGARILNKLSDDAYQVGMTVKLGPVNMQYRGLLTVLERNAADHRAVLGGKAQETRGQGTADATVTLALTEDGTTTRGTVNAELALSGKAAAMGKSVIGSVTEQMMGIFAGNLQAMLAEPGAGTGPGQQEHTAAGTGTTAAPGPASAASGGAGAGTGTTAAPSPAPAASAEPPSPSPVPEPPTPSPSPSPLPSPSPPPSPSPLPGQPSPAGSLDAFTLARGIAVDQLSSPGKVAGLVAAVAVLAYWAGRRSAFRLLRLCGRL
ncbi:SRPBCC family protein [Arthrobacter sp. B3I4]|uniref:SRPBCC family protein n=1 Tax=Arthrobacter sp. B3I4 TaxID=3042267 RepID=UPI00278226BE|nr:SRPBCC family protein [Arthrobacter sp. B3I4]MDQ0756564.1 carbon monoxide dehydrogenase subunit G [Arthrobacter sp. B3I4]